MMEMKTTIATILVLYICLLGISSVHCRTRGVRNHHNNHHKHHHNHQVSDNDNYHPNSRHERRNRPSSSFDEDYDEDYDDGGRHAYVMTSDNDKKSSTEKPTEDQTLANAFEKHMKPTDKNARNSHDVYAYQLPSDLWFVVRYKRNDDGQVEKYMNIVDSFTNYLDKLDKDVKSVSVNVKGVETVFRLTTKRKGP